jgi:hypothetical protein
MGEIAVVELCICGHKIKEHAEFVDNTTASASYKPERRHCLHLSGDGTFKQENKCSCQTYKHLRLGDMSLPDLEASSRAARHLDPEGLKLDSEPPASSYPGMLNGPPLDELMDTRAEVHKKVNVEPEEVDLTHESLEFYICSLCINSKYPGILWPTKNDSGYAWIQRCDDCDLFVSDRAAACFLSAVTGLPIKLGEHHPGIEIYYTPIEGSLVESMAKSMRIG